MQRIERYGVIALVFLLVTILAVSLWGESKEFAPGGDEAEGVVAEAPRPDAPISNTSLASSRGARDRALPTSDHTLASNATPRDRTLSRNPNVLDPEPAQPETTKRRRGRNSLPTPSSAPASSPSRDSVATERRARDTRASQKVTAQAATEYVPRAEPDTRRQASRNTNQSSDRSTGTERALAVASMRTCVVAGGETLSQIAQRELGTYRRWPEIAALNDDLDPAKVRKGMVLKLPARDSKQAAQVVAKAMPASAPKAETSSAKRSSGSRVYRIQKGDVLSVIAQRELGSAKRWKEIVALNPKVNPDRLIVGAKLTLPGSSSTASAKPTQPKSNAKSPAKGTRVAKAETSGSGGWSGTNGNGSKVR